LVNRLAERFAALQARGEKALVCYAMAGDPSPEQTVEIVQALEKGGADILELGIPFSDPLADGPSIQAAGHRALAKGVNVPKVLEIVRAIRRDSEIPLVLMTYYNPVLRYGAARFARDAASAGVDATIQVDLTPEEADEWVAASRAQGLDTIFLLAPTSTPQRIEVVCRLSTGFVYCVSRTGVTGARSDVPVELPALVAHVREKAAAPVCVGFGISQPEHVRNIAAFADGVVVGSALVNVIARCGDSPNLAKEVRAFAAGLKEATRKK
jgi:tryptophan synthase alpha chain